MAIRRRKTCRWSISLVEAFLLHGLLLTAGHAANSNAAADAAPADAALIAGPDDSAAHIGGEDLYLEVTLNGAQKGLAHFAERDGKLWASLATLHQLGFVLPAETTDPVRLDAVPGLKADYDANRQSLTLVAPLKLLELATTTLNAPAEIRPRASAAPGALLNYTLYGTAGNQGNSLSAFTELRAFDNLGTFSTTALAQAADNAGNGSIAQNHFVRLDTSWASSFPDSLLTLRIGDTLTDALAWSRPTRIGGIQFGTNFALQPYLLTVPLPAFFGSATLPSNVELYVNGVRQYSGQVPAGPFQLNTIPSISGAGNAQVVLTNALGQTTTLNFPLYGEHQLLREGLSDWSAEIGFVRENYGLESFDYGHDAVGSATWRHGFSNNFTAEAHAEVTNGLTDAGVGGNWLLGEAGGVVSASLARSQYSGRSGSQYSLGYNWTDSRFNFLVNGTRTQGDYRDVAALYGSPTARLSAQALVGYNTGALGTFGVGYVHLRYPQQPASRYASGNWSRSFGRNLSFNFSVNQNLDRASDRSVFLVATVSFDRNISVSGGAERQNGRNEVFATASEPLPSQGGFGWRAAANGGDGQNGGQAELDYLGRYGQAAAGVYAIGNTRYGYASASGSLVLMDGELFAARQISNGFAVVSTDGIPGVPVNLENNPVGTTNDRGLLLVTPLNSYQNNQLSIDPMDLPADVRIDHVKTLAAPADRAGVMVRFGITPVRAASLILVDAAGKPLPVGSRVRVRGQSGQPALVGFDGAVYLDTLELHNVLDVDTPAGPCTVRFDYSQQGNGIPQIGPLVCRRETP